MADEVAELKVLLTGDGNSLENTIRKAETELRGLEKVNGKTVKSIAEMTRQSGGFRAVVDQSKKSLDAQKETLKSTETAYKANTKAIKAQISGLEKQKSSLQNLAYSKKEEIETLEAANAGLSKNSVAYKDNLKAIEWTKAELDAVQKQRKKVNTSIADHETALTREEQALTNARNAVQGASRRYETMNTIMKDVERQEKALNLQETGKNWQDVGSAVDTATKPFQRMALLTAAGGVAAAKFAIDFEDSFAGVEKTVEGTPEQLEAIKQGIIDLSTVGIEGRNPIPQTTAELNELAAAGGQLGIQTEHIIGFTETMAQMGTATNLAGEEGAQTLARFMNVANVSQGQVKNLGSSIVDLGNNYATTEAEIAAMALRMGATASVVGIGAADILGYAAALSSMGVEAEAGGSAVSRILMEIQQAASSGGEDLAMFANLAGKSSKEFAKQWGEDASGAFQDFLRGLSESKDQVKVLSDLGFNNVRDIQALQRLAGEQGFGLLTSAIQRANTAWMENTALQAEFDKKAETTASQLQIMKNNLVESARSIGETFLPDIVNASNGVKEFAQGIAKMDEGQKQTLITTGKWVIGLGTAAKGTAGVIKGVGKASETIGRFQELAGGSGMAGTLAKLALKAPAAALAVAGIGVAALAAKKGYDAWYNSQYRWTDGLSKGNDEIRESMEALRTLSAAQQEIKAQKLVIENPDSSQEQVEQAKSKIQEIAAMLEKEYNLKISTDGGTEKLENTVDLLTEISKNELQIKMSAQSDKLEALQGKLADYQRDRQEIQQKFDDALASKNRIGEARKQLAELEKGTADYDGEVRRLANDAGLVVTPMSKTSELISELNTNYDIAGYKVKEYGNQLNNLDGTNAEAIALSKELANWNTELIAMEALNKNADGVARSLEKMGGLIRAANLDLNGYAQAAALAMNGVNSLEDAWTAAANGDGEALNGIVNDYIRASSEFGAAAQDTAVGASLIKNGFRTLDEAVKKEGAVGKIAEDYETLGREMGLSANEIIKGSALIRKGFTDIKSAAKAGALDEVSKEMTRLAHEMGELPENKSITVDVNGDTSILTEIDGKVQEIQRADGTTVRINADGNVEVLDQAGNQTKYLEGVGAVNLKVNAKGNIEVLNEAGEKVEDIPPDTEKLLTVTGSYPGKEEVAAALDHQNSLKNVNVTYTVTYAQKGSPTLAQPFAHQAKGTSDFSGGLAMINDQRGVADPRELVEVGGRGYLFEGRDVVLPLPEHAKIYPAGETKEILRMAGIPHYARGKDNDAWSNAKDAWSHRQKTALVPLSAKDYIAWINEMRGEFQSNTEAMMELDEMFVDAVKQDWDEALDAIQYSLDMGGISEAEYYAQLEQYRDENIQAGTDAYKSLSVKIHQYNEKVLEDARNTANEISKQWIDTRTSLNDWGEIGDTRGAAYNRVMDRNAEALFAGKMTWEEYQALGLETFETLAKGYKQYSDDWISREKEYNNMSAAQQLEAITRQEDELNRFFADVGELTDEQYVVKVTLDTEIAQAKMDAIRAEYSEWKSDFEWYQQQQDVYGVDFMHRGETAESTLRRGIDKMWEKYAKADPTYQQEILRDIDLAKMEIYKNREQELDDALSDFSDKISETTQALDDKVQALRDKWTVEDRRKDMGELEYQLSIYEGAVTKEGRDKYESLQEEYTQLQRDEQIYNLEQKNSAAIERMEEQYAEMEAAKAEELSALKTELLQTREASRTAVETVNSAIGQEIAKAELIQSTTEKMLGLFEGDKGMAKNLEALLEAVNNKQYDINQSFTAVINDQTDLHAFGHSIARYTRNALGIFG